MIIKFREDVEGPDFLAVTERPDSYEGGVQIEPDDPLVTVSSLIDLWTDEIENANYHFMTDVPGHIVKVLRDRAVTEPIIKLILWDILTAYNGFIE